LDYVVVRGVVADASDEPLRARIVLTDDAGEEVVGVFSTNERTGRYLMVLAPGQRYRMTVEAAGFEPQQDVVVAKSGQGGDREMNLDIVLSRGAAVQRLERHD
jgi:hypothetical protein